MTLDNTLKILLAGASLCLGSYLTALRSKVTSSKIKNKLHYSFYVITGLFFISAVISIFYYWADLFFEKGILKPNYFALLIILACITATILLFFFTKRNLVGKYQYKTSELNPIVENPRKLTPLRHGKLTPVGHIKLTPCRQHKLTPCKVS